MASLPLTILPTAPHTHTIIFLHGRGSNATEFCSEIFESQNSSGLHFTSLFPSVKWVFPCAKQTWSELDQEEMHQWFDITSVQNAQEDPEVQRPGLEDSRVQLRAAIAAETSNVRSDKIIIAGISQGCATALYTLLSSDIHVGGFFGLCGWLPLAGELVKDRGPSQGWQGVRNIPILLQHSEDDDVVPIANGRMMYGCLEEQGMNVKWQQFKEGGH